MKRLVRCGWLCLAAIALGCAGGGQPKTPADAGQTPVEGAEIHPAPVESGAGEVSPAAVDADRPEGTDPAETGAGTEVAVADGAQWMRLPLVGEATVEALEDGQYLIRAETRTPSPGWKVVLRPAPSSGAAAVSADHGWVELEIVGSPPPGSAADAGGPGVKATAQLRRTLPENITLIIHGESDGRPVSQVPALP